MAHNKVTIDVEARFIDNVTSPATKVDKTVDKLGKKKPKVVIDANEKGASEKVDKVEKKLNKLEKKKPKPTIDAQDNASKKILGIMDKAKSLASRIYTTVVNLKDNDALSHLAAIEGKARSIAGKAWTAVIKVKDMALAPLKALHDRLFSIKTLIAGIATGMAAKQFILNPINLADQYSGAKIGFSTLLGESRGQEMMNEIDAFAKATPFKTSGVISNVQKMMAYGWDVDKVISDMKTIGDAAAATGKGDQGLESIVYALSEIRSKGKLSTQELNQLASAGIKAKAYLAEGLGFGTSDEGMAKLAKSLEKGEVGANKAIELILQGMKEFDGMMDKTANETVEGLKSQLEDTFEINILRRWGQGLQDGAKRGLGSVVSLLDEADGALVAFGDTVYEVGKELSNYFANVLDNTVKRIKDITETDAFKNASLGEKISMLWEGAIANPFADWWDDTVAPWWDNTAVPWLTKKAGKLGTTIGTGLSNGILMLLGAKGIGDMADQGAGVATSFVQGFLDGFDGAAVSNAIIDAVKGAWEAMPTWAKFLLGGMAVSKGAGMLQSIGGLVGTVGGAVGKGVGMIGATGNAMVAGSGVLGGLANAGYALTGGAANAAGYFGVAGGGLSGAAAAGIGAAGIAGGAVGGVSAISGGIDLYRGYTDKNMNEDVSRAHKTSGALKLGGVATGAMIGGALGGPLGALLGAGVGGVAGWLGGNKVKKAAAENAATMEELRNQTDQNSKATEVLQKKEDALAKALGNVSLSYGEIKEVASNVLTGSMAAGMSKFSTATAEAETALKNFEGGAEALNKLNWKASVGYKFDDAGKEGYKQAVENFITSAEAAVESEHYKFTAAVEMLIDPKSKEGKSIIKGGDSFYAGLQKQIDDTQTKLTKQIDIALKDGKIDADEGKIIEKLQNKIAKITNKVAKAENEAKMEAIKIKFGAGAIDAASMEQLQKEIEAQITSSTATQDQALETSITSLKLQLDKGAIDQKEYDEQIKTLTEGYNANIEEIHANAEKVQLEILSDAFDIPKDQLQSALENSIKEGIAPMNWSAEQAQSFLNTEGLTTQMATGIGTALQTVAETSKMDLSAITVEGTEKLQEDARTKGETAVKNAFKDPISTEATINATAKVNWTISNPKPNLNTNVDGKGARGGIFYPQNMHVARFGAGGQVQGGAQLAVLAEEGTPEMVIPLGSQRRKRGLDLWAQAGHMLGVPGYAAGGIVGGRDEGLRFQNTGSGATAGQGMTVNVGGVTVQISVDGSGNNPDLVTAIKEQGGEIAEQVAGILADAFNSQFENTPTKGVA